MDPSEIDIDVLITVLFGEPDYTEVEGPIERIEAAEDYSHACWAWMQAQYCETRVRQVSVEIRTLIIGLEARLEEITGPWQTRQAGYERMVELWHRRAIREQPKTPKTIEFPTGGSSTLRAQQPVLAGTPNHEELLAWVEETTTNEGEPLSAAVYPVKRQTLAEQFKVSQLKKVAAPEVSKGAEPGTHVPMVHRETGEVVPGVSYIVREDRWEAGQ